MNFNYDNILSNLFKSEKSESQNIIQKQSGKSESKK
jgi:hypothetical protein